ncbi:methyltransferase domain-containing protein [Caviibacterium pharyngocola]|uniref:SAM-dependent methyltransferase n=1 Tax=Caviibacterium pharyngocola TaxID=28159 RepID=A0A2M8RYK5_9PAST|nr:methyltransferase domain-containing protein [Caviibacterium pharyngocola]PJG83968.1 SAM-dependent methyltransferase [Caviibacterium pharyngocola]
MKRNDLFATVRLPASWQEIPQGEQYCTLLGDFFAPYFSTVAEEQFLQLGGLSGEIPCAPHCHQIILHPEIHENLTALSARPNFSVIQAEFTALPFVQGSINACLLANTLNFCADPYVLLREILRVLSDDGYLFVSLFNPYNPTMLKNAFGIGQHAVPFYLRFPHLIVQWLEQRGFRLQLQQNLSLSKNDRTFAPFSILIAQKQTYRVISADPQLNFNSTKELATATAFRRIKEH